MKHALLTVATGTVLTLGSATLTTAQTVLSGDHSVDGKLCVGSSCHGAETFDQIDAQKIKGTLVSLRFEDTSGSTHPSRDWRLRVNDGGSLSTGGLNRFSIEDVDAGTIPFTIVGDAPDNALFIDRFGRIGLGTTLPFNDLHIVSSYRPTIRLEQDNTAGPVAQIFELEADDRGFRINDASNYNDAIFQIEDGAPAYALSIAGTGNVGFGTLSPSAPLELSRDDTYNYFRITAAQAAINESVDITFTGGPLGTGELRYNVVDGDGPEMKLNADGDMQIDGTLTTAGSCSVGCDAVFEADYPLPSIEDHLAETLALGHLPNVGPTRHGEPWDMTDKMGRVLNELEHAHLYIGQLHAQNSAQAAQIAALSARLDAIEADD